MKNAGLIAPPPILYLGTLTLAWVLNILLPLPALDFGPYLRLGLGAGLISSGLALAAWSFATLRRHGTPGNPLRATLKLVTDGPFARSRNPIYLAQNLLYLGLSVGLANLWTFLLLPPLLLLLHHGVIYREERYLQTLFGQAYIDYGQRTPRWF